MDSEIRGRLAARAATAHVDVDPTLINQLARYLEQLTRWNRTLNLTGLAVDPPDDHAIDRLCIEPLVAAALVPDLPLRWVDVGSGGGSPAVPLKCVRPDAQLTMVESNGRKAAFLNELIRVLKLNTAVVGHVRIEELSRKPEIAGTVDLVTLRAVKLDRAVLDAIRALLLPRGRLLLFSSDLPEGFEEERKVSAGAQVFTLWRRVSRGT